MTIQYKWLLVLAGTWTTTIFAEAAVESTMAMSGGTVHFSGEIVSADGAVPPGLSAFADCRDQRPRIVGRVAEGKYQVDLPTRVNCAVRIGSWEWAARTVRVVDAATAVALPVLVYRREMAEPALASELVALGKQDQALRHGWSTEPGFQERATAEDGVRQRRLDDIIAAKGWPTLSMVGEEAANAAWLIAQHAPKPSLERYLGLMQGAAAKHEIDPSNLATSIDRVRMYNNQPQLYGTQYQTRADGRVATWPVEDTSTLDERRLGMGLPTYAEHEAMMEGKLEPLVPRSAAMREMVK